MRTVMCACLMKSMHFSIVCMRNVSLFDSWHMLLIDPFIDKSNEIDFQTCQNRFLMDMCHFVSCQQKFFINTNCFLLFDLSSSASFCTRKRPFWNDSDPLHIVNAEKWIHLRFMVERIFFYSFELIHLFGYTVLWGIQTCMTSLSTRHFKCPWLTHTLVFENID